MYLVTYEFGIPVIYKPEVVIRKLRKLFSQYNLLNKQIRMLKNNIQAIATDNGYTLNSKEKNALLSSKSGIAVLETLDISKASEISIKVSLELLWTIEEQKEYLALKKYLF